MIDEFLVPDYGVEDLINSDPNTYISQWKELMKDGDCVIAIQRRQANAIGRKMHSYGFTNEQVWKAYNIARTACGLCTVEMPAKVTK